MIRARTTRFRCLGAALVAALLLGVVATAQAQKAAVVAAVRPTESTWYQYVQKKISDTKLYPDGVDYVNVCCAVPTLTQLANYKLLVVLSSSYGLDSGTAIGSVLGDYMAMVPGASVLVFYPYTWQTGLGTAPALGDKFLANYALTSQSSSATTTAAKRGMVVANDPLAAGVPAFTCGSGCTRLTGLSLKPGATASAFWDDGTLLAVRGNHRVDLNMMPADDSVISGSFSADGGALITNSILYLGGALVANPGSASFASTPLGGSSAPTTITFRNVTSSTLSITGIVLDGPDKLQFAFKAPAIPSAAAPLAVPAGSSFTIDVRYKPQAQGTHQGSLLLTLSNLTQVAVPLGGSSKGNLYVVRSPVDFGGIPTGTTAGPVTVRLTNTGSAPVDLDKPTLDDCTHYQLGTPVADARVTLIKGASYPLTVQFTPGMTPGQFPASITVTSTDASSPLTIPVLGMAGAPQLQVPYTSLVLPDVANGAMGLPVSLVLTNAGNSELDVTSIAASAPDFVVPMAPSAMDPLRIAPHASATFQLVFAPKDHGLRTGTLTIQSNEPPAMGMPSSDKIVSLVGTGTVPQLRVDATQLDFGQITVGTPVAPRTVTLYNDGDGDLNVTDLSIPMGAHSASFVLASGLPVPFVVHAGAAVPVNVGFAPKEAGMLTASLRVVTDLLGMGGTAMVTLQGTANGAIAQVSPATLDFGNQKVKVPAHKTLTITNRGNQPLTLRHAQFGQAMSAFSAALPADNTQVAAGASLTLSVSVNCPMIGQASDQLEIDTDDQSMPGGTPFVIALTASGTMSSVSIAPTLLDFGAPIYVGQTSNMQAVTVHNSGTTPVDNLSVRTSGADSADFAVAMGFKTRLMPGEDTTIAFAFQPHVAKVQNVASAVIAADGIAAMMTVALQGSSLSPMLTVQPGTVQFEATAAGAQSMARDVTLSNPGPQPLEIEIVPPPSGDFLIDASQTVLMLNPGDVTRLRVTFAPQSAGHKSDSIDLRLKGTSVVIDSVAIAGLGTATRPPQMGGGCSATGAATAPAGLLVLLAGCLALWIHRRRFAFARR